MFKKAFFALAVMISLSGTANARPDTILQVAEDVVVEESSVIDSVTAIYGNAEIMGRVEKDVVVVGGTLTLGPASYVGGDITIVMGVINRSPSAVVEGDITRISLPRAMPFIKGLLRHGWITLLAAVGTLLLLGILGLAILLSSLMPGHINAMVAAIDRGFFLMFFMGIFWAVLIIPIGILLAISIVGILIIPVEFMVVVLALLIGSVASASFVGKKILEKYRDKTIPFLDLLIGVLILFFIGFVPVVGALVQTFFIIAGFGACVTTRFGTVK